MLHPLSSIGFPSAVLQHLLTGYAVAALLPFFLCSPRLDLGSSTCLVCLHHSCHLWALPTGILSEWVRQSSENPRRRIPISQEDISLLHWEAANKPRPGSRRNQNAGLVKDWVRGPKVNNWHKNGVGHSTLKWSRAIQKDLWLDLPRHCLTSCRL